MKMFVLIVVFFCVSVIVLVDKIVVVGGKVFIGIVQGILEFVIVLIDNNIVVSVFNGVDVLIGYIVIDVIGKYVMLGLVGVYI